jgi:hypothetical protein
MPRPARKTHDKSSDAGEVPSLKWRRKIARGASPEKKIYNVQSRNMYENKENNDNLSTKMTAFLHNCMAIV